MEKKFITVNYVTKEVEENKDLLDFKKKVERRMITKAVVGLVLLIVSTFVPDVTPAPIILAGLAYGMILSTLLDLI